MGKGTVAFQEWRMKLSKAIQSNNVDDVIDAAEAQKKLMTFLDRPRDKKGKFLPTKPINLKNKP